MAIMDRSGRPCRCPLPIEVPDRVPKERYYDPDFYRLEAEQLWPRVWQMACRLEEIPQPGDFVEYEILDQSVIVVRTEDMGVRAFQNACRHRGVRVVQGRGSCPAGSSARSTAGATAPTGRTPASPSRRRSPSTTSQPDDLDLDAGAVRDVGRVRLDQPGRRRPAAAGVHRAVRHHPRRLEDGVAAGRVVVRLPASRSTGSSAEEAFVEQYHVLADPSAAADPRALPGPRRPFDPRAFVDVELQYLATMSDGHGGHGPRARRADRRGASRTWSSRPTRAWRARPGTARLNEAVVSLAPRPRAATSPTSTSSRSRASTSRWASASPTSSCCRCTAAPPPTASGRSAPRRPSWRSGR